MQADLNPEHIMQVGLGFMGSKALLSAVELELFTVLAAHPTQPLKSATDWPCIRVDSTTF